MPSRILVIEDEPKWHEQYKDILGEDWELDLAEDFQKATVLLKNSTYHLVLLDVCLNKPIFDVDCQKFVSFLREQYSTLPVFATTGKPLEPPELETLFQLGEGGIVDYMHKKYLNILDFRLRIQRARKKYPLIIKKQIPVKSFEYDVFISYSHEDKDWVQNSLLPKIEKEQICFCIDSRDFKPGLSSVAEMERAVTESSKTLLILTAGYQNSKWAEFEFIMAHTLGTATEQKRLIPILLKPCELRPIFKSLVYLDFTKPENEGILFAKLITSIKS